MTLSGLLWFSCSYTQTKTIEFGKITPDVFSQPAPAFDSNASAVILEDIGSNKFDKNGYAMTYTRYMRVKIINKNGFDAGNFEIYLDNLGRDPERLSDLRGSTYNMENGVIRETKLDDASVYKQKFINKTTILKFSMPALKSGSVFELAYTIHSPFFELILRPWNFQGRYPCLWSEYEVGISAPYHYILNIKGDEHFDLDTVHEFTETFGRNEINEFFNYDVAATNQYVQGSVSGKSFTRRWIRKNIPGEFREPFVSALSNYNQRISFQLDYIQWPGSEDKRHFLPTWNYLCQEFYKMEGFGLALKHDQNWVYSDIKNIEKGETSDEDKARSIYAYVRDNIKATSSYGLVAQKSLKEVYEQKSGNEAEINLLLVMMLQKAGLSADPMILSTSENGVANPLYPMINEYNYVICVVRINGENVMLDASQPYLGYGEIPLNCYNGYGHIINEEISIPIYLSPDSVKEQKITNVLILQDDRDSLSGTLTCKPGLYESYVLREKIGGSSQKELEQKITNGNESVISNFQIEDLNKYDVGVIYHYDFDLKPFGKADVVYFDPVIGEGMKKNPFMSAVRRYPVEIPAPTDERYILTMDIPKGYTVDEFPKSARVNYNENEGFFEYLMEKNESTLRLDVHIKLNKTTFSVEEYPALRDFFSNIVKKESEQIVFKKTR